MQQAKCVTSKFVIVDIIILSAPSFNICNHYESDWNKSFRSYYGCSFRSNAFILLRKTQTSMTQEDLQRFQQRHIYPNGMDTKGHIY